MTRKASIYTILAVCMLIPARETQAQTIVFKTSLSVQGNHINSGPYAVNETYYADDVDHAWQGNVSNSDYSIGLSAHDGVLSIDSTASGSGEENTSGWGYFVGNKHSFGVEAYVEAPAGTIVRTRKSIAYSGSIGGNRGILGITVDSLTEQWRYSPPSTLTYAFESEWTNLATTGSYNLSGYGSRVFSRVQDLTPNWFFHLGHAERFGGLMTWNFSSNASYTSEVQVVPETGALTMFCASFLVLLARRKR